jgi:hypothetical protein
MSISKSLNGDGSELNDRRWVLDRTISANTIMSIGAMLAAVVGAYYGLRAEVALVDGRVTALANRFDYEQAANRRLFEDIRASLRRIEDKLDGKVDKPGR